ncbi:hypothetical protein EXA23_03745 [Vibrio cincinnatiensis]|uniref:hypothetical protein n=1 Tax=Vibrio cincinnatiensis TaxID=675 RepID=UPI001EE099AD|nr:hypothetical protein [Vibrio cincinnatiensis]MCG3735666.1 hypothetical protein [Vibrio cincinnatiensis]MCG3747508.1 hypothetical protein [Vibrio cincinnatiensis]MCG3765335.1 hypothetical protein [Vibrio cincinnatiensis]
MKLSYIAQGVIAAQLTFSPTIYAAQSGLITFMGTVAVATCEKKITVNNSLSATNQVQLKALDSQLPTEPVRFSMTTASVEGGKCRAAEAAEVYWTSPVMSARGLENFSGTASGAYLSLIPQSNPEYRHGKKVYSVENGMDFSATLHQGETTGSFNTIATISVVYY